MEIQDWAADEIYFRYCHISWYFLQPGKYQLWCRWYRLKFWISVWRFPVILANSNSGAADTDWNEVMAAARETINRQRQRPAKNGLVANCWQSKCKSLSLSVFALSCNCRSFSWFCLRPCLWLWMDLLLSLSEIKWLSFFSQPRKRTIKIANRNKLLMGCNRQKCKRSFESSNGKQVQVFAVANKIEIRALGILLLWYHESSV